MSNTIKTVGVVGTGVIGASWVTLFLARGLKVIVSDPAPGAKERLIDFIEAAWPTQQALGLGATADPKNFEFVENVVDHLDRVQFVQENAPERLDLKIKLFAELDARAPSDVILTSSSSGITSSAFVKECKNNPGRILIGHPFNPLHIVPLIEVVPHENTAPDVVEKTLAFYKSLGKSPVWIKKETPGFVANRLQAAICMEAYSLVSRGVVTAEELDIACTASVGLRWALTGPFMTNVLGGGGGKEGFSHIMTHLGPAMRSWSLDMDANKFDWDEKSLEAMNTSVVNMVEQTDMEALSKERDDVLIGLIKAKKENKSLI